jgi:Ca-activated chloride channel family protein
MISFDWPFMFYLLPLPLLLYFLVPGKKQPQTAVFMPTAFKQPLDATTDSNSTSKPINLLLLSLAWLALITMAAKPVRIGDIVELPNNGRDMFLAVDISGSMQERDMPLDGRRVDRLTMVKSVLAEFIQKRQGDRLGLILFGSNAYIQAPLTFDLTTVENLLKESEIGFAGRGTAIGNAIGLSIKRLANNPADSRVLILLTDGENTAGDVDPIQAATLAKQENVVVYTVGIGSAWAQRTSRGVDARSLKEIANITGGQFFMATDAYNLNQIYQYIDQLQAIERDTEKLRPKQDLFYYPLLVSLILLLLPFSQVLMEKLRGQHD